jgi:hypothetical protein
MSTVYINKVKAESKQKKNTSGAGLVQYQFVVMAGLCLVADEAIASNVVGGFTNVNGMEIEAADYVTSEGTFATANAPAYWDPATGKFSDTQTIGYYLIGYTQAAKSGSMVKIDCIDPNYIGDEQELSGRVVSMTVDLTAAAAATPVNIIPASQVPAGKKIYITGFLLNVGGATAWTDTTATIVKLQDTAASPVVAATAAKAQLTGNAALGPNSTGITLGAPILTGAGLTAAKGLDIVADAVFAAGSTIHATVNAIIK